MNNTNPLIVFVVSLLSCCVMAKNPPNVIVIMTDDQLHNTMAYYGGDVLTPNIDNLAHSGMVFTNAYVSTTVCSPSRYTLLTGRYAGRNTSTEFLKHFPAGDMLRVENVNVNLETDGMNLQTQLKRRGYTTGIVGKWHLGPHLNTVHNPSWDTFGFKTYAQDTDPSTDTQANAAMKNNQSVLQAHLKKTYGWDYAASLYAANLKELRNDTLNTHNIDWTVKGALDFPYLVKNSHLGHFSSAQNPHYFELDQLYDLSEDPTEENNILYDAKGVPRSEIQLTDTEKAKRGHMQNLLTDYLRTFTGRPFGELK